MGSSIGQLAVTLRGQKLVVLADTKAINLASYLWSHADVRHQARHARSFDGNRCDYLRTGESIYWSNLKCVFPEATQLSTYVV